MRGLASSKRYILPGMASHAYCSTYILPSSPPVSYILLLKVPLPLSAYLRLSGSSMFPGKSSAGAVRSRGQCRGLLPVPGLKAMFPLPRTPYRSRRSPPYVPKAPKGASGDGPAKERANETHAFRMLPFRSRGRALMTTAKLCPP